MVLQQVLAFLLLAMAQLGVVRSRSTISYADFSDDENSFQFRNDYFGVSGSVDDWCLLFWREGSSYSRRSHPAYPTAVTVPTDRFLVRVAVLSRSCSAALMQMAVIKPCLQPGSSNIDPLRFFMYK